MTGVAPYQGPNSPLNGFPAIIWGTNRRTPVGGKTISLVLQGDGDLVLRGIGSDGVETVPWRSKTSGRGVTRMQLSQQPSNLVLYDAGNVTVWQSSTYPADTLTYGQRLRMGKNLVSYASGNVSGVQYSLEINRASSVTQLTLLFKKYAFSQAIPYWNWQLNGTSSSRRQASCGTNIVTCNSSPSTSPPSRPLIDLTAAFISPDGFSVGDTSNGGNYTAIQGLTYAISEQDLNSTILRLDPDGSLRLLSIKKTTSVVLADLFSAEDACSLPQVCGTYGVCIGAKKQCTCPNVNAPMSMIAPRVSSFALSDPNDPSKGCTSVSPLPPCPNPTMALKAENNSSALILPVEMQIVEGVAYFSTLQGSAEVISNVSSGDTCSTLCLHNCTCLVAFWRADLHVCSHVAEQQLGSFRGGLDSTVYKAYLKVLTLLSPVDPPLVAPLPGPFDSPIQQNNARKIAIGVGVSIAALFVASSFLHAEAPSKVLLHELHAATKGFSHLLGKGGFGSVYAGVLDDGTTKVAVKKLEGVRQGDKEFKTEIAIMGGIHHYNLLELMGYCSEGAEKRLLVYKYMEKGSLDQWIFASSSARVTTLLDDKADEQATTRLKWGIRYAIAVGVAKGLAYLHEECEKRIIHLDIKPQNILLDEGFVAKVADFGLSKGMEREESHVVTTMRGTPGYLAPEWIRDGTINVKCDVFSFGMLLMEIVSGRKNVDISRTEAPFYPEWAYSQLVSDKLVQCNNNSMFNLMRDDSHMGGMAYNHLQKLFTVDDLTDAKLESEKERVQVRRLITTAFLCVLERPEWRPPMTKVVQMLEGHISISHIDLLSLHQGLLFLLRSHNSSSNGSPRYANQALELHREFQDGPENILGLSSSSFPTTSLVEEISQLSGR
ncbi:hypothetical protein L7F22_008110 [Adiantum nelumboides]|nr:hypothetical protein [Adiantum nelumboides]